ncbi:MAG: endonuclease III [Lachnospiraceae bacterium]|nr:endonuclease III [Lachnospiraceae bacterium]
MCASRRAAGAAGKRAGQESARARKKRACEIVQRLKAEYPDTHCTLAYDEAWKLLVSVRLAAQCTDARVDQITPVLYEHFPTIEAIAEASEDDIEAIVRPCGLGRSKARDIKACMTMLRDVYGCRVPDTMEELLKLPGVGRKSANLVLGDIYGKPAIVTDTHCIRLANRMGLVDDERDPHKVEKLLSEIIPPEESNDFCHRMVDHGRAVCTARTAQLYCERCCLADLCPKRV